MTRNREQRLDRCLMCVLDAFGAPDPLVVDEPPPLAAVEVGSEVHQRVDHLLAPLLELGHGDRRGDLMREDRKGPPWTAVYPLWLATPNMPSDRPPASRACAQAE